MKLAPRLPLTQYELAPQNNRRNRIYKNLADRLLSHCGKVGECWIWSGATNKKGYGRVTIRVHGYPTGMWAHRLAFELLTGVKIPVGATLDHTCTNNACINPKHLEIVTREENSKRRWARERVQNTIRI